MNAKAILADPSFPELKRFVLRHTGLWYYVDKNEDLAARVARRMIAVQSPTCQEYLNLLEQGAGARQEMECLIGELTIGETYFFRQIEHFDLLRNRIVPELLEQNAETQRIRIWSAGCATGEEPYSLAILLEREFGAALAGWDVSIVAGDINSEFLARAQAAHYGEWALRATPLEIREQCFERREKTWVLRPEYRKRVTFQQLNLASDKAMFLLAGAFDVIFCRNVLIYFGNDLIQQTAARFWDALRPGGWLVLGHAEFNPTVFARFARVCEGGASVYQKPGGETMAPERGPWAPLPGLVELPVLRRRTKEPARTAQAPDPEAPPAGAKLQDVRDLADCGSWQAALALCKELTESDPLNAPAHFTLGLILESTMSPGDAEASLRRAIYLDRNFALAHYHLANCLQMEGKAAQARKSFQNTVQLLSNLPPGQRVEHADGMTAADLKEMAMLHLELLEMRETTA